MKRGRKPRPDELDLWNQVARSVKPHDRLDQLAKREAAQQRHLGSPKTPVTPPQNTGGKIHFKDELSPTLAQSLAVQPVRMDHKAYRRLLRGRVKPDARLDLHGMTLDRAHAALARFVMAQHASGKRLLLVITGKGKRSEDTGPIPMRQGALRHQVPEWLRLQPLAGVVLQVTQAHASHGGAGAYYVYLRKLR
jgi:DNA-nicking Smr family endonuclease